jgi:hypothetical protein
MKGRLAARGCTLRAGLLLLLSGGLLLTGLFLLYNVPAIHERLFWRVETLRAEVIRRVRPQPETLPTPLPAGTPAALAGLPATPTPAPSNTAQPSATPAPETVTLLPTATATPTATPLPASALIGDVVHEYQGWNNCGPATLAMNLRFWGWDGDQKITAAWLKPDSEDKNVRPDEMEAYVAGQVPGLAAAFRVGGSLDLLRTLIANGYPLIVAKGLWHGDSGWIGHYLLVTGYDDAAQEITAQDSLYGPEAHSAYDEFDGEWQMFDRAFVVIYPEADSTQVMAVLGQHASAEGSYQAALETAHAETQADPGNAFAWHNLGTNLDYLGDYAGASAAFDEARRIGLPWRMLWYQTGLYSAYYHAGRYQDVLVLANLTLEGALVDIEESLYWRARAKHALGDAIGARRDYQRALAFNPNFEPARSALAELEGSGL